MGDDLTTFRVAEPMLFRGELTQILHCARHPIIKQPNMIRQTRFKSISRLDCIEKTEQVTTSNKGKDRVLEATSNSWINSMMDECLTG